MHWVFLLLKCCMAVPLGWRCQQVCKLVSLMSPGSLMLRSTSDGLREASKKLDAQAIELIQKQFKHNRK